MDARLFTSNKNNNVQITTKMPQLGLPHDGINTGLIYCDSSIFRQYTLSDKLDKINVEKNSYNEKYKIHVGIDINAYTKYLGKILDLLINALYVGVIDEFKVINIEEISPAEMIETLLQLQKDPDAINVLSNNQRIFTNPITIYIPDDVDTHKLNQLCFELEYVLNDCPTAPLFLSSCDVAFTSHLSLRQETLNGFYIAAYRGTQEELAALKKSIHESKILADLCSQFNSSCKI